MENLSMRYAYKINKYMKKEGLELEKMRLGIEIFLLTITKFIVVIITAYILNLVLLTLIAIASSSLLKMNAFGLHSKKSSVCTIITTSVFVGSAYISKHFIFNNYVVLAIMTVVILTLYKYAPADTEARPILGKKLRKKLKIKSILWAFVILIVALIVNDGSVKTALSLGALFEAITTITFIYKILGRRYNNYEKYE